MKNPFIAILLLIGVRLSAATYYVATNGSDSNPGTNVAAPFATTSKAMSVITSGDTIIVRGGTYVMTDELKTSKAGYETNRCKLWAYLGETPVFDYSGVAIGKRGIYVSKDYWHIKGIEVAYARDNGIIIAGGGYALIEGCIIHDSNDDGICLGSTTSATYSNLILNCDSYRNYQVGSSGNNGDGYAAKKGAGPSNIFRGCRAWYNSDDGWDCYDNDNDSITLEYCWSFHNGTNLWNVSGFQGNGNGFKLGGAGTLGRHTAKNCMAFDNHSKGFDHNGSLAGHTLYNCTGFRNGKWNFSFYDIPTNGTNVFRNCLSYLGLGTGGTNIIAAGANMASNSWQGYAVSAVDFVSLDPALAFAPRNADFSLPTSGFARLASGSQFIDKGVDVGLPFSGTRPDLGAYEFGSSGAAQTPSVFDVAGCYSSNGGFRLKLDGLTSHGPVVLYASTNLISWMPIITNAPTTGSLLLTGATAYGRSFFRAEER